MKEMGKFAKFLCIAGVGIVSAIVVIVMGGVVPSVVKSILDS